MSYTNKSVQKIDYLDETEGMQAKYWITNVSEKKSCYSAKSNTSNNKIMNISVKWEGVEQLVITTDGETAKSKLMVDETCDWIPMSVLPDRINQASLERFMSSRLPSKNRGDINEILSYYGVDKYDIYELCKKTQGRKMTDSLELIISYKE